MDSKAEVIKILTENSGRSISGEYIAGKLGISRAAVCKAVSSLKREGYNISSATNRGYMLLVSDRLDPAAIEKMAGEGIAVEYFEETESTNDIARTRAAEGAAEGTVILAASQSRGRGRKGRNFASPKGGGIYLSIVLRPDINAEKSLFITVAAAVAAARAIQQAAGEKAYVKWVNDVYCRGKKVCGILTEASVNMETYMLDYAVVGVGINVYPPEGGFPDEIKDIAGAVCTGEKAENLRNSIAAQFIREFMQLYKNADTAQFMEEYRWRSNILGKEITVWQGNNVYTAFAEDIDEAGGLVVRTDDGQRHTLQSGEITIRSKENE